jgi:hypothetical protein
MEPVTLVAAYAQIVGLIADYMSVKGHAGTVKMEDFVAWLATHGHADVVALIERNQATSVSIKAALSEGTTKILERLEGLEKMLGAGSVGNGAFDQLALAVAPGSRLSAQQSAILCSFETQGAGKALLLQHLEGEALTFLDANGGYEPDDKRFFETDLDDLVASGLLSLSFNGSGGKVFHLTRPGHELARQLSAKP